MIQNNPKVLTEVAKSLICSEEYEKAIPYFKEALEEDPRNFDDWYSLGKAFYYSNYIDNALEAFLFDLKRHSNHNSTLFYIGEIYFDKGQYEEAINYQKRALEIIPNDTDCLYSLGKNYRELKDYKMANYYFKKAYKNGEKEDYYSIFYIARTYEYLDKKKKAKKYYLKLLDLFPDKPEPYFRLGIIHQEEEEHDTALMFFKQAYQVDSEYLEVLVKLVKISSDNEDYQKMIIYCQEYLNLDPKNDAILYNIGYAYKGFGMIDEALASFKQSLEYDSNYAPAWYEVGKIYSELEEWELGIEYLQNALKLDNLNFEILFQLGKAYLNNREFHKAISNYKKCLKMQPNDNYTLFYIGCAYKRTGQLSQAIDCFLKCIEIEPDNTLAMIDLAEIYLERGDAKKAKKYYEKALELDKEALWQVGDVFFKRKDYKKSVFYYEEALKEDLNNPEILYKLGEAYYKMGRIKEGITHYQKSLQIDPDNTEGWTRLGEIFFERKEIEKAINAYKKVLKISPEDVEINKKIDELTILKDQNQGEKRLNGNAPSYIKIFRGGGWKIEGDQSVFNYKVKVQNTSNYILNDIHILLTSIPPSVSCKETLKVIASLKPNSFISPTFKLRASQSCVGDIIQGVVSFNNHKGNSHSVHLKPFRIKYVCNLLVPKRISQKKYREKVSKMSNFINGYRCKGNPQELIDYIFQVLERNNFYILPDSSPNEKNEGQKIIKLKGYAQGKYDKEDVALEVALQKMEEHTNLILKSMSTKMEKLYDINKDISAQCFDIKTDTELISEYMPLLEEIFEKVGQLDEIEEYLRENLGSTWVRLKNAWEDYKQKKIPLKGFLKRLLKVGGGKILKTLSKVLI